MISKDVESINGLIEKLRLGKIEGIIEIVVNNKGNVHTINLKKQKEKKQTSKTKRIELEEPDLSHADLSGMDIKGSFYGFDLHEVNFSYSRIENSDLSQANLANANFYKAIISQTDMKNAYGINPQGAYLTGSVDLYDVNPEPSAITNPYGDGIPHEADHYDEDEYAEHPVEMSRLSMQMLEAIGQRKRKY